MIPGKRRPHARFLLEMGSFLRQPQDLALFVEKRFGVGYTVNFGHPQRWTVVAITLLPLVISYYLLR
jgi:uncharacterized membrane protein